MRGKAGSLEDTECLGNGFESAEASGGVTGVSTMNRIVLCPEKLSLGPWATYEPTKRVNWLCHLS